MHEAIRHRACIGELLIAGGFVQPEQLRRAVALNAVYKKRIGEILEDERAINHTETLAVLHLQDHLDHLDISRCEQGGLPQELQLSLGQLLIDNGQITPEQLEVALLKHQSERLHLGESLVECKLLSERTLAFWLDLQKKLVAAATAALLVCSPGLVAADGLDDRPFANEVSMISAELGAGVDFNQDVQPRRFLKKDIETKKTSLGEFAVNDDGSAMVSLTKEGVAFTQKF